MVAFKTTFFIDFSALMSYWAVIVVWFIAAFVSGSAVSSLVGSNQVGLEVKWVSVSSKIDGYKGSLAF